MLTCSHLAGITESKRATIIITQGIYVMHTNIDDDTIQEYNYYYLEYIMNGKIC